MLVATSSKFGVCLFTFLLKKHMAEKNKRENLTDEDKAKKVAAFILLSSLPFSRVA